MTELNPFEVANLTKATAIAKKQIEQASGIAHKMIKSNNHEHIDALVIAIAQIIATNYAANIAANQP